MPYTVEICFDKKSDKKIRDLWDLLAQKNISAFMLTNNMNPHITLTVINEEIDRKIVNKKIEKFVQKVNPLEIIFSHVGSFPSNNSQGVVFLAPTVSMDLLKFHRKFHDYFTDYIDEQEDYYFPQKWVPHCTLAINISQDQIANAINETLVGFDPIKAKINTINYVKYHPVEILSKYSFE